MHLLDCIATRPYSIDVTDITEDYSNVYKLESANFRDKYYFIYNGIYITSCDSYQLALVQEYLNINVEIIPPEPDTEQTKDEGIEIMIGGDFNDPTFYQRHVEHLAIGLYNNHNRSDLAKILRKPCSRLTIKGMDDNVVIRDCTFPKCNELSLLNVSLSQEARESINTKTLIVRINHGNVGLNNIYARFFNISGEVGCTYIMNKTCKNVYINNRSVEIKISSEDLDSLVDNCVVTLEKCVNLQELSVNEDSNYSGILLITDPESRANITKYTGYLSDFDGLDVKKLSEFLPRLIHLSTNHLDANTDISNIRSLYMEVDHNIGRYNNFRDYETVNHDIVKLYKKLLLSAEDLSTLIVYNTEENEEEWDEIFIELLRRGNMRYINLPAGIDMNKYPNVAFYPDNANTVEHNIRARMRNTTLASLF